MVRKYLSRGPWLIPSHETVLGSWLSPGHPTKLGSRLSPGHPTKMGSRLSPGHPTKMWVLGLALAILRNLKMVPAGLKTKTKQNRTKQNKNNNNNDNKNQQQQQQQQRQRQRQRQRQDNNNNNNNNKNKNKNKNKTSQQPCPPQYLPDIYSGLALGLISGWKPPNARMAPVVWETDAWLATLAQRAGCTAFNPWHKGLPGSVWKHQLGII